MDNKRIFKVGDKVQIKSYEEMEKEFGMGCENLINCYCGFPRTMEHLCGRTAKIKSIDGKKIELEEWSETIGNMDWDFSTDMIKHMDFLLDDLQFADIVTLRNGEKYVVADGYLHGEDDCYDGDCRNLNDWYRNDLTQNQYEEDKDIVKVERDGSIVYQREDIHEMTIAEISKKLGYEVKIVKE